MKYVRSKNSGFSLIEVMLAVLVLSTGILAVSKLQTSLIRSGSDANYRSTAASIAQNKINDLRRFTYVTTSEMSTPIEWNSLAVNSTTGLKYPLSLSFAHIADDKGGRIQAGDISNGSQTFDLHWTSDAYSYSTPNSIATPAATADDPAFKKVHVVVEWDGVGDNTNSLVSFDTVIGSYSFSNTDLGGNNITGGSGPVVDYDPLAAPDVVPVELGVDNLKKETSKPLPDVSKKGDSTLVHFETVTYNIDEDTQRREEFRTLACNCKSPSGPSNPNTSIIYGYVTWDDTEETLVDITTTLPTSISKWEVDNGGGEDQDDACTFCCRDGSDLAGSFKVCRLKRIDGVLRIIDPWKLVAFNMVPASYFDDSTGGVTGMTTAIQNTNIERYSSYVTTTVRNILAATGSKNALANYSTVDISFIDDTSSFTNNSGTVEHLLFSHGANNNRHIQVRGIYMDYPPSGIFTKITNQTTYYSAADVPLDRVPFYEVNLTQLAGWIPDVNVGKSGSNLGDQSFSDYTEQHDDMDNSSCQQTDNPDSSRNYVTNEEFFYSGGTTTTCNNASRGDFHPITTTSVETITSEIFTNSDGIVDRNINSNTTIDVSLDLEVQ